MKHIFILILIAIIGAIAYALFIFMSPSHYMQKVAGSTKLTNEWVTITPPRPLEIRYRKQELSLRVENVRKWDVNDEKNPTAFITPDGEEVMLEAQLVGSDGKYYPAKNLQLGRGATLSYDGSFPEGLSIEKVRLRSSHPLKLLSVFWVCYSSK